MKKLFSIALTSTFLACVCGVQASAAESSLAQRIKGQTVFTSPIIWVGTGEPPAAESEVLQGAIAAFQQMGVHQGYEAIESFLSRHPASLWAPSLHLHLAERYRELGRYSMALKHWQQSWVLTKELPDPEARNLAARALTGWLKLLGSLGRKEQMKDLLNEAEQRGLFDSPFAPALRSSREALAVMEGRPGDAFRCGTVALAQLMKSIDPETLPWRVIHNTPSSEGGFKLNELVGLAESNSFQVVAVLRQTGAEIPVPSVVHWKLDHYAAIVELRDGRYKVVDPTFGGHKWLDAQTINDEASGHFLVPESRVLPGWKQSSIAEAARVHGKGYTQGVNDEDDNTGEDGGDDDCDPPDANDGPEGGGEPCPPDAGMPVWSVSDPYMTLWIHDVPLYYRNARGGWEKLRLSYKQRTVPRGDTVAGFGDGWECNWIGFLEKDSANPDVVRNYLAGGGITRFPTNGTPDYFSGRRLAVAAGGSSGTIESSGSGGGGGSSVSASSASGGGGVVRTASFASPMARPSGGINNRYGFPFNYGAGITRLFRTNQFDRYGRQINFNFDKVTVGVSDYIRLTNRVDKDGRSCTLAYTNTAFPRLITSVTDPYGRTAYFKYDHLGRLTNITDMAGIPSSFRYHSDGSITNMITPYGTNSFKFFNRAGGPAVWGRGIEITEPGGTKQLFTYHDGTGSGVGHHMYSYHWNRARYAALSSGGKADPMDGMSSVDFDLAPIKEWMRTDTDMYVANLNGTLYKQWDPVDLQLGQRTGYIRYNYPEQGTIGYNVIGPIKSPDAIYWESTGDKMEIPRNTWGRPTEIRYFRTIDSVVTSVSFTNVFNADGRRLEKVWGPNGEQVRGYGYTNTTLTNLLTSVTNALGEVIRYTYDSGVRVTSITHPSGLVTTNIYYTSGTHPGFLKTRIEVGFRTNHYSWVNGNLEWHTNELGLATKRTWDNLNRTTSIIYPDGTTISNVYDNLDLVKVKDRLNQWTFYGYNRVQQMIAQTNANGQVTEWDYCGCGAPGQITVWNGGTPLITQYSYNMAGRVTNVVYPDNYSLNYLYDVGGRLANVTDPTGRQLLLTYGDYGSLKTSALYAWDYSSGGVISDLTYDAYGRVATIVDRNGITITNRYDILGRLTNSATLDIYGYVSNTVSYAYTARGLTNSTDELGHKTWFVYDAAGRLLSQTNANNEALQFTYNPADQMLTLKDGKNQQTSWNYDEYGRVTNKLDAVREIFRYKYDQLDRLTNRWTAAKGDTFYRYDSIGNLTNVDYPSTIMDIVLKYDGVNRLTNVVDAIGTTKFGYNNAGQLMSEDGPWADDAVSYNYNARQRELMSVLQPNASPWTQNYGYDGIGRLSSVTSGAGAFGYDYLSAISDRVQYLHLPGSSWATIVNEYDPLARLKGTALNTPAGAPVNRHGYEHNAANQRIRQTFNEGYAVGGAASSHFTDYTYDAIGQLKAARGTDHVYDGAGSLYVDTPRKHEQFGYAYDAAWNLNRRTNNLLVQTFGVNNLNELTNATRSGTFTVAGQATGPRADVYGPANGVTNVAVSGTGLTTGNAELYADGAWAKTNATLANGNNTYTATAKDTYDRTAVDSLTLNLPATNTFAYDYNGNLTNDGRRVLEYDYENQLTNVYVASAWRSEFKYDGFGRRRTRKEYTWQSSAWLLTNEVRYVYDGMLVVQERDANNLPQVSYTRGNDLSGNLQGAGGIGGLLARTSNSELLSPSSSANAHAYYHCDGNGNITTLVNTNGFVVARYNYDPYGNLLGMSGSLAEANTYRFSSKEWHANAALYYYGYRCYEPNLQRWLNRDLLGDTASLPSLITLSLSIDSEVDEGMANTDFQEAWIRVNGNLHGALGNSPQNLIDPHGLDANSYADCLERYRNPITEQLPNAIAERLGSERRVPGWVPPAAHAGNAIANRAVGDTRRTGIGGKKPHPTTWQNKLGREVARKAGKPKIGQIGKWFGRAAVVMTIAEGFWDLGLLAGCGIAEALPD